MERRLPDTPWHVGYAKKKETAHINENDMDDIFSFQRNPKAYMTNNIHKHSNM